MKTPLRHRLKARELMKRRRVRGKQHGWVSRGFWVRKDWLDQMAQTATRLGMSQRAVSLAVFEVGLRRLQSGDVLAADRRWHEQASLPMCRLLKEKKLIVNRDPVTGRILGYSPKEGAA